MALESEVMLSLLEVTDIDVLNTVGTELKIVIPAGKEGNIQFIIRLCLRALNEESIVTSDDEGAAVFLKIRDLLKTFGDREKEKPLEEIKIKKEPDDYPENLVSPVILQKLRRDFKINGSIGTPGQKDKLSYMSLSYQIQKGKKDGRSGEEICSAVIKAITPGSSLRNYLESRLDLDEKQLIKVLRSHFSEKDSPTVFNEMSNCVQGASESELDFCLRAMSLRQKVLMLATEEECPYDPKTIKKRFLHAIFTGLKFNNIRHELQSVLKSEDISDEDLLKEVSSVVANELEHSVKLKSKTVVVNELEILPKKIEKKNNPLLVEINKIAAQVNELTALRNDFDEMKKEFRSYTGKSPSNLRAGASPFNSGENRFRNTRRNFRCENCRISDIMNCNHCFSCGKSGHRRIDCKAEKN